MACLSCAVTYKPIGQRIDEQGTLHEPFALIPLGYLTGTAALVTSTAALITSRKRRDGSAMPRRRFTGDGTGPRKATAPPNHYIVDWKDPAQPEKGTVWFW